MILAKFARSIKLELNEIPIISSSFSLVSFNEFNPLNAIKEKIVEIAKESKLSIININSGNSWIDAGYDKEIKGNEIAVNDNENLKYIVALFNNISNFCCSLLFSKYYH